MVRLQRILVPTDFSETSSGAWTHVRDLLGDAAEVHWVHVMNAGEERAAAEQRLAEPLEGEAKAATVTRALLMGSPVEALVEYARRAEVDLVVMGTHARSGLARMALGSVAEQVMRTAPCAVLVVRPALLVPSLREVATKLSAACPKLSQETAEEVERMLASAAKQTFGLTMSASAHLIQELERHAWLRISPDGQAHWTLDNGFEDDEQLVSTAGATSSPALDLLSRARRVRATDIHLDPAENAEILVRFRVDGKLEEYCRLSQHVGEHLLNQFKTLSDITTADPFVPKEGRLQLPPALGDLEVRLTAAPVTEGEAMALRLFDRESIFLPMETLGMGDTTLNRVHQMVRCREGLVLVTGPTGAGKTTTVYSALTQLGGVERNVVSVEDPVEFAVPFVRQSNVDLRHGVTMTSGLRTILRMDPDVIFLGEIRDAEAAGIAMRAAASGKYVLSTLHTRDIAATFTALRDMGLPDRSLAGNVTGVVNQRLLRRLCTACKQPVTPPDDLLSQWQAMGISAPESVFAAEGCAQCRQTGYLGRVGIFEAALLEPPLATAVASGAAESELTAVLRELDVECLLKDALQKVAAGVTSWDEAQAIHWLR